MSEAAERVEAWRREKRKAGYRPVLLWLSIEAKSELDALAYRRHQDPSACVADAVHALATRQGPSKATGLNIKQVEDLISRKLAEVVTTQHLAPPAATPPEVDEPIPEGMKRCGKGHLYHANKNECPHCARARKQAARARKKAERQGEVPSVV
jgi:hypothetical protein